ncbi:helix-turn-helix domain-containing protein [Chitinophaga sp. RAB17]|uniref:helix-turn-helix domain-containing protein n=1 Tax=Chitinophaga sp. RAB17 TaxID=3233049 RepID=UPI003F8E4499
MYFKTLPDHTAPGFDEQLHFSKFSKHNIIFNATVSKSYCEDHVGCLSLKAVLSGEEWYRVNNIDIAVRPTQFLMLNEDQSYSSSINSCEKVKSLAVFFKREFAAEVFYDTINTEEKLLDGPAATSILPEFHQTLYTADLLFQQRISQLINHLDECGYNKTSTDEQLTYLLRHLIAQQTKEKIRTKRVDAVKSGTRTEIYKRLCVAKDVLHSTFKEDIDLNVLSSLACLSAPQLIRQFRNVFQTTPHQYLTRIRLEHAVALLKDSTLSIQQITWMCGFENASAFCRVFKSWYGISPDASRNRK